LWLNDKVECREWVRTQKRGNIVLVSEGLKLPVNQMKTDDINGINIMISNSVSEFGHQGRI